MLRLDRGSDFHILSNVFFHNFVKFLQRIPNQGLIVNGNLGIVCEVCLINCQKILRLKKRNQFNQCRFNCLIAAGSHCFSRQITNRVSDLKQNLLDINGCWNHTTLKLFLVKCIDAWNSLTFKLNPVNTGNQLLSCVLNNCRIVRFGNYLEKLLIIEKIKWRIAFSVIFNDGLDVIFYFFQTFIDFLKSFVQTCNKKLGHFYSCVNTSVGGEKFHDTFVDFFTVLKLWVIWYFLDIE